MISFQCFQLATVALCCVAILASADIKATETLSDLPNYSATFEILESEPDFGISETLSLLKDLRDLYKHETKPKKNDDWLTTLSGLISASEPDRHKCSQEGMKSLDVLVHTALNSETIKRTSINKYIKYYSGLQYEMCRQTVVDRMKEFSNQFTGKQKTFLDSLLNNVLREMAGTTGELRTKKNLDLLDHFRSEKFARGIFASIRQTNFGLGIIFPFVIRWHKKNNYEEFVSHFKKYMKEACSPILESIGPLTNAIESLLNDARLTGDQLVSWDLAAKIRICRIITRNMFEIANATRDVWQQS